LLIPNWLCTVRDLVTSLKMQNGQLINHLGLRKHHPHFIDSS
jgi:hypothetical protein